MRLLLREWFLRIHEPHKARRKLFTLIGGSRAQGPRLGLSPARVVRVGLEALRWRRQSKRLRSVGAGSSPPSEVQVKTSSFPSPLIGNLLTYARVEGATLNDLLISILARSLQEVAAATSDIAIAASMDLRPYTPADLSEAFGSLLAYPLIVAPAEKLADFRRLLLHVARQNHALKDIRELSIRLALMRLLFWRTQRLAGQAATDFFRRHLPVMGVVTNVNMTRSWAIGYHPRPIVAYYRYAPLPPTVPLAISATTLDSSFNVSFTWRSSLLPDDKAMTLLRQITTNLAALSG